MTDGIILACDVAVRVALTASAKRIRNHRPRNLRDTGPDDTLHTRLTPPPTREELAALSIWRWDALSSALIAAGVSGGEVVRVISACADYERARLVDQRAHDPADLADRVSGVVCDAAAH